VGLFLGFGLMLISWLVCLGLSTALGLDLYWPMTGAWAIWAALDSRRLKLDRFERVFPLQPMPLAFSVFFLWPISLPWYIHLRAKAESGNLTQPPGPSRARYVLVAVAAAVPIIALGSGFLVNHSRTFSPLRAAQMALSHEPQVMRLNYNTSGTLTLTVQNSTMPSNAREAEAHRLASLLAAAVDSFHSVKAVSVGFVKVTGTAGLTYTRAEGRYGWPMTQLVGETTPSSGP
jgi:hypothetical protein